jgi:hypothetical protein
MPNYDASVLSGTPPKLKAMLNFLKKKDAASVYRSDLDDPERLRELRGNIFRQCPRISKPAMRELCRAIIDASDLGISYEEMARGKINPEVEF